MDRDKVTELRLVVTTPDYVEALHFYRDVLGLRAKASYSAAGGQVTVLEVGRATLELNDSAYAAYIDEVEVGRRVAGHMRVAFEVSDTESVTSDLVDAGARLLAGPVRTPWGSLNSRLDGPGGLQLTLFSSEADS
jgi:catechol 2,3-dioxygenase-like lactoylglutathione lyase family enzyme